MKLHLTENRIWSYKLHMPIRRSKINSWILFLSTLTLQDGENHVSVKINVPQPWDRVRGTTQGASKAADSRAASGHSGFDFLTV